MISGTEHYSQHVRCLGSIDKYFRTVKKSDFDSNKAIAGEKKELLKDSAPGVAGFKLLLRTCTWYCTNASEDEQHGSEIVRNYFNDTYGDSIANLAYEARGIREGRVTTRDIQELDKSCKELEKLRAQNREDAKRALDDYFEVSNEDAHKTGKLFDKQEKRRIRASIMDAMSVASLARKRGKQSDDNFGEKIKSKVNARLAAWINRSDSLNGGCFPETSALLRDSNKGWKSFSLRAEREWAMSEPVEDGIGEAKPAGEDKQQYSAIFLNLEQTNQEVTNLLKELPIHGEYSQKLLTEPRRLLNQIASHLAIIDALDNRLQTADSGKGKEKGDDPVGDKGRMIAVLRALRKDVEQMQLEVEQFQKCIDDVIEHNPFHESRIKKGLLVWYRAALDRLDEIPDSNSVQNAREALKTRIEKLKSQSGEKVTKESAYYLGEDRELFPEKLGELFEREINNIVKLLDPLKAKNTKSDTREELGRCVNERLNSKKKWKPVERSISARIFGQSGNFISEITPASKVAGLSQAYRDHGLEGVNSNTTAEIHATNGAITRLWRSLGGSRVLSFSGTRHANLHGRGFKDRVIESERNNYASRSRSDDGLHKAGESYQRIEQSSVAIDDEESGDSGDEAEVAAGVSRNVFADLKIDSTAHNKTVRENVNDSRAYEALVMAVEANAMLKQELLRYQNEEQKEGDKLPVVRLMSNNVQTGFSKIPKWMTLWDGNEALMICEQEAALKRLEGVRTVTFADDKGLLHEVDVQVAVPTCVNVPVNAYQDYGARMANRLLHDSVIDLIGSDGRFDKVNGSVGDYLKNINKRLKELRGSDSTSLEYGNLLQEKDIILELVDQVRMLLGRRNTKGAQETDAYDLAALLNVLAHKTGSSVLFNCKSGKDRTGYLDALTKYVVMQIETKGRVPHLSEAWSEDDKNAFAWVLMHSGNLEWQAKNVSVPGYKVGGAALDRLPAHVRTSIMGGKKVQKP